ncbi:enoyl-CoA hydratase/isomerase family protein [Aspergillus homomorphus CBS 101889]|uniref:Saccharopine dehydrogenase n=1 Tax=Aspergillus homomorphus (strain CBS 101889) TaxID=1450537 RepID=A0A395I2S4_ASPHC|nr:hypothetical protein BO97DRAFT_477301 [Aspergillus homomorphus CBS 101889]RAL13488.1 hypothetical protein BO97DRAFT_477301 [Aspergillus homomorphus CBS 101889]
MPSATGKKALLLGAGFVCEPTIQALSEAGVQVTVGCRTLNAAQSLAGKYSNTTAISLDVANEANKLDAAVGQADIIVSLIPYIHHATVVKAAIAHSKPVVTTSFISPALWELDAPAKSAGVTVLNEIGLNPGIDHLYAVKTIDEVHRAGGKINAFTSYCGALPAPENSDNPLRHKFSWSPRGGLLALLNSAQWYRDGKVTSVDGRDLMASATPQRIFPGFNLVGYPNRDSVGLRKSYAIPEAQTVFRGTLRYAGFPEVIQALVGIGYFSQDRIAALAADAGRELTWAQLTAQLLGLPASASAEEVQGAVARKCLGFIAGKEEELDRVLSGLRWIGLFDEDRLVDERDTPLDTLCAVLERRMAYQPGERDMIILQHVFDIENADRSTERRTSTLVEYGDPVGPGSRSAMAKLVGLPCAVGVLAVLEGRIQGTGMLAPWTNAEIAGLLREELKARFQIELKESITNPSKSTLSSPTTTMNTSKPNPLFTIPIASTGGTFTCTNPTSAEQDQTIYILTFTSPKDNRLTPTFIDAFLLALDIIEHRYPKGVVITTSGIPKFYSNGLDLDLALSTEGFTEKWLWKLFRRLLTYPMPTIALLNGHAFAGGLMLTMYHDYRIQNPSRGYLCINELEFGVPLESPMMSVFREKLAPTAFRDLVLEAKRFGGPTASLEAGLVDGFGGLEEAVRFVKDRGLQTKAATGIYGMMKEEMWRHSLGILDGHAENVAWRERVEEKKEGEGEMARRRIEAWEKERKVGAKL